MDWASEIQPFLFHVVGAPYARGLGLTLFHTQGEES